MAKNRQPILRRARLWAFPPRFLVTPRKPTATPSRTAASSLNMACSWLRSRRLSSSMVSSMRQFRGYYARAERKQGNTGEVLLQELERRLDNVVFRMGYANTRREARQLVTHGHFTVNGRRVNIPSYQVKPGEVIAVCEKSRASEKFKALIEQNGKNPCPKWIEKAADAFEGKIVAMPARDDIDYDVVEHLIVELYNK